MFKFSFFPHFLSANSINNSLFLSKRLTTNKRYLDHCSLTKTIVNKLIFVIIEKFIGLLNLPFSPSILSIQLGAIFFIIFQEIVYVLTVHVVAYSLFPKFKLTIPDPPRLLNSLVDFNN